MNSAGRSESKIRRPSDNSIYAQVRRDSNRDAESGQKEGVEGADALAESQPLNLLSLRSKNDNALPNLASPIVIGIGSNTSGAARVSSRQLKLNRELNQPIATNRLETNLAGENQLLGQTSEIELWSSPSISSLLSDNVNESSSPVAVASAHPNGNTSQIAAEDVASEDGGGSIQEVQRELSGVVVDEPSESQSGDTSPPSRNALTERLKALRARQAEDALRVKMVLDSEQ